MQHATADRHLNLSDVVHRRVVLRLLRYGAWAAAAVSLWVFVRKWWAPDACLDRGGSFDYVRWKCDTLFDHPYIEIPVFAHAEFWIFVACGLVATALSVASRANRKV